MNIDNVSFLSHASTCIDELDIRLAKRQGMLAAIMHADAGLEKKRLNSVMLTAIDNTVANWSMKMRRSSWVTYPASS